MGGRTWVNREPSFCKVGHLQQQGRLSRRKKYNMIAHGFTRFTPPLHMAKQMSSPARRHRVRCRQALEAPPSVDRQVFVISLRGTIWGLPRDDNPDEDGAFPIQVHAFECNEDAEYMARRVWIHRLKTHRWPCFVKGRLWLASANDIILHSPNPLQVDEINLKWLLDRMGKTLAAVWVVFPLDLDADEVDMRGQYMDARVPTQQQVEWLDKMFKRNANPNRE